MFEKIIKTISEEKEESTLATKLFSNIFNIMAIAVLVGMFFEPMIKVSGNWVKVTISIVFLVLFLGLVLSGSILAIRWLFSSNKKEKQEAPQVTKKRFSLGDELINRLRMDKKGFFKKAALLEEFEKKDLEAFRDWLDYRIKYEGIVIGVILAFVKYLPTLREKFDALFIEGGFLHSEFLANPLEIGIYPISMDLILLLGTLLVVLLTSFMPRRIRILNTVKYAVGHGCHKPEKIVDF